MPDEPAVIKASEEHGLESFLRSGNTDIKANRQDLEYANLVLQNYTLDSVRKAERAGDERRAELAVWQSCYKVGALAETRLWKHLHDVFAIAAVHFKPKSKDAG